MNSISSRPLNGQKIHPLSANAISELQRISLLPLPRNQFNPGVAHRLALENLVETVSLPSPYKTHKGRRVDHLQITEEGKARLLQMTGKESPR